jgi:antibiotic biosynthesis monooxygenase (ABM) superfamily enzyme
VPGWLLTLRGAARGLTAGAVAGRGPVTGVIRWRAKPGTENDVAERATGITVAAERFPGNLSAALIQEKGSRDFHPLWQFARGQVLQRWLRGAPARPGGTSHAEVSPHAAPSRLGPHRRRVSDAAVTAGQPRRRSGRTVLRRPGHRGLTSPERARRHDRVRDIAGARTAVQQRAGLEARFCVPGHTAQTIKPPPRWKQWLVSLVAAYPLVLLFQAFIAPQIKDWPLEAKSALLPLCVLTLLTYVVMPPVSRLLGGWLHPSSRARRRGRSRQHSSGAAARVRPRRPHRTPPSARFSPAPSPMPRSSTWHWKASATTSGRPGRPRAPEFPGSK